VWQDKRKIEAGACTCHDVSPVRRVAQVCIPPRAGNYALWGKGEPAPRKQGQDKRTAGADPASVAER